MAISKSATLLDIGVMERTSVMKIRRLFAVVLVAVIMLPANLFAFAESTENSDSGWTAADFTYSDVSLLANEEIGQVSNLFELYPMDAQNDKLEGIIHVVTGFSDSGQEKLDAGNTDLVIPARDAEGRKVQGIANSAFSRKGLTSLELPQNIIAYNNGKWDESVSKRGDFFIGSSAFSYNSLTSLELPKGVIYIGTSAFGNNQLQEVSFPSTIMFIGQQAFLRNSISSLT